MAGNKKTTASIYPGVDPIVDPDSEKTKEGPGLRLRNPCGGLLAEDCSMMTRGFKLSDVTSSDQQDSVIFIVTIVV